VVRSAADEVLEPSSGSGVFILSVARRLRQLGQKTPIQQLWACDIDPVACAQTRQSSGLSEEHVWNADFLDLVGRDGVKGHKFDCVVGNPPYVSLHRMSDYQRRRAKGAADRLNLAVGRRASLWAYFLSIAAHVLRPNGRVAFILPESILHAEYAIAMVRTFATNFAQCSLVSVRERCFVPDGAAERVVILLADGFRSSARPTEISLHECLTADSAVTFLSGLRNGKKSSLTTLNGHAVPHLLPLTKKSTIELSTAPGSHPFGEFADIKIGVVTGADDFFLLSEDERRKLKLRRSWLVPVIPRFQECRGLAYRRQDWGKLLTRGERCWMLSPSLSLSSAALRSYLGTFPSGRKKENRTFAKRKLWYAPILGRKAHAFLRYMGAAGPRLAFARFDCNCTNVIHRVYFCASVAPLKRKAIVLSLHSSFSQLSAEFEGRAYGSGVLKLEPSETRRLRLLLPAKLNRNRIDQCFEAVDRELRKGNVVTATAFVDEWLYQSIPRLEAAIPRQRLKSILDQSIQRRLGYPQAFITLATRRSDSKGSASEMPSAPSNRCRIQNAAEEFVLRRNALPSAKFDQTQSF
jgi:tRNA1(Val) A37 N6-methylase TrmN6